jgi:uncharacterized protein YcbX
MKRIVTGIYIYPIKSLGGISLQSSSFCSTGLQYDRRWMLVDKTGCFITQREMKQLCLFAVSMNTTHFTVSYLHQQINIPLALTKGERVMVKVWESEVEAITANAEINNWFSMNLQRPVKLVYMPDTTYRSINPAHVIINEQVGFADGYPVLMIGEASLHLLQSKVSEVIPMDRFRPNIVFNSVQPHEEDLWQYFTINTLTLRGIKPCKRCVVTTINQQNSAMGAEPLKTLSTYRKVDNHILFGQNVAVPAVGNFDVGDEITVVNYLPLSLPT